MEDDDLILCITCGDYADLNAPHTGNWDDYGHSDPAHYPSWYPHAPVIDKGECVTHIPGACDGTTRDCLHKENNS